MTQPTLKKGAKGDAVRQLQEALVAAGFDPGTPDGHFGNKTDQAVRAFQADRGLGVDGVAGARTWAALRTPGPAPSRPPSAPSGGGGAGGSSGDAGTDADTDFIHDVSRSTLEFLTDDQRRRFEGTEWGWLDFPGNKSKPVADMGPDELARYHRDANIRLESEKFFVGTGQGEAEALFGALAGVRPGGGERRVNRRPTAVLTKEQFVTAPAAFDAYIEAQLVPLAGQGSKMRMNTLAAEVFARLRAAAQADGVMITVRSAFRERDVAERNAARAGNAKAVAGFSPHCLGLAMDLALWVPEMAVTGEVWKEISTRPFADVVRMLYAPAYKWMYTQGAAFGFYMYSPESWHWEYNPLGFKDRFYAAKPSLRPES